MFGAKDGQNLSIYPPHCHVMNVPMPTPETNLDARDRGCMAGLAVGNVLGLGVEPYSRSEVRIRIGAVGLFKKLPIEE